MAPAKQNDWEEVGGSAGLPFLRMSEVKAGTLLKVTVLEVHVGDAVLSKHVREKDGWEAVAEVNGRECVMAVTNPALSRWLRTNGKPDVTVELLPSGEGFERCWKCRVA